MEQHTESIQPKFTLYDKNGKGRTSYKIENKSNKSITVIEVDSLIEKQHSQCDILVLNCTNLSAYFVEFKGDEPNKALTQIIETIQRLKYGIADYNQIHARLIQTKVHQLSTIIRGTPYAKLIKVIKEHKGSIEIKSQTFTEIL